MMKALKERFNDNGFDELSLHEFGNKSPFYYFYWLMRYTSNSTETKDSINRFIESVRIYLDMSYEDRNTIRYIRDKGLVWRGEGAELFTNIHEELLSFEYLDIEERNKCVRKINKRLLES